jgi:prepilin-type N-terminal cleavage/methylation domain-containing protein
MKNKKGFTLIELLIVIAIIGILLSIFFAPKHRHSSPSTSTESSQTVRDQLVQTITGISKADINRDKESVTFYTSQGMYTFTPVDMSNCPINYTETKVYKKSTESYYFYYFK